MPKWCSYTVVLSLPDTFFFETDTRCLAGTRDMIEPSEQTRMALGSILVLACDWKTMGIFPLLALSLALALHLWPRGRYEHPRSVLALLVKTSLSLSLSTLVYLDDLTDLFFILLYSNPDLRTLPPELGRLVDCYHLKLLNLNLKDLPKRARPGEHSDVSNIPFYYMAQMVGVLWLVDYRSITFRYGPENFIRALWLINELGNNILVMDRLWLSAVWLGDGAHFLARALHLRNTKALVNVRKTGRYDEEKTAH